MQSLWISTQQLVIPSYTRNMKTAISLPDETYDQATTLAKKLGMSRSEFFARAAEKYAIELSASSLTAHINQALEASTSDDSAHAAVAAGRRRLAAEDDW
jgi:antitoxin MazE6